MKKKIKLNFIVTGSLFLLFVLLIISILTIDVRPIGSKQSNIGFASVNKLVFESLGVNMVMYHITDWLSVVAIAVALCFTILGLTQLIKGKTIKKVDYKILLLGAFYITVIACYVLFEYVVINYRPIILEENLEPSFPSSTTLITVSIMGAAMIMYKFIFKKNKSLYVIGNAFSVVIIVITVIGRLISGVHWFTDIMGGLLLAAFLIMLYYSLVKFVEYKLLTKNL